MERTNKILATIAVVLIPLNYWICEYFYADDLAKWWRLRTNIYSFEFLSVFYLLQVVKIDRYLVFIFSLACGLCLSDFIDRAWFNINYYTTNDCLFLMASVIGSTIKTLTWKSIK